MTEQSPVINATIDNNPANTNENSNQNVEQETTNATSEQEITEKTELAELPNKTEFPEQTNAETSSKVLSEQSPTKVSTPKPEKNRNQIDAEVLAELKECLATKRTIQAKVEDRVRGGLKLNYKGVALFLPTSHFDVRSNPNEEELIRAVGDLLEVEVLEINDDVPTHKRNIIVSRKNLLETKFWNNIKVGDIVSGPVSSITTFGIFIDIGGYEGLVHISRLSRKKIDNPKNFAKKGDILQAKVVEVDTERKRIGLSIVDLEPSPWLNINEKYPVGSTVNAKVKRFVDFGAFVELENGIEGLIRNADLSWTQRINHPKEVLTIGQEIQAQVTSINPDKELISLSYRATQPNPWKDIEQKIQVGSQKTGIVKQIKNEGVVITIEDSIDGFMPKSKMRNLMKGNKIPFKKGEQIEVVVADIAPAQQSLILEPKDFEQPETKERKESRSEQKEKKQKQHKEETNNTQPIEMTTTEVGNFSFSDILGEEILSKLLNKR